MSDNTTQGVINAIMPHVRHREVAGVLFQRCGAHAAALPAATIPGEAARGAVKGTVNQASIAAQSSDDPAVLSKLARDQRVTVRRIVAANPATATADQRYLLEWALKNDDETLQGVCRNMAVDQSYALLDAAAANIPWGALTRAMRKQAASEVARAAWTKHPESRRYLVPTLVADRYPEFTLREALAGVDNAVDLLAKGLAGARRLRGREAAYVVEHQDSLMRVVRADSVIVSAKCELDDSAAFALLTAKHPAMWATVALNGPLTTGVLKSLVAKNDQLVAAALQRRGDTPRLTRAQVHQLVEPISKAGYGYVAAFLKDKAKHLESNQVLTLLRHAHLEVTEEWLTGKLAHKPRPGDVAALVADPGSAFDSRRYMQANTGSASHEEIVQRLQSELSSILTTPWAEELVDALGIAVITLVVHNPLMAQWFAQRLEAAFGDDPRLWETAVGLAAKWDQGVSALIEAAFMANGLSRSNPDVPVTEAPAEETQLHLPLLA